MITIDEKIDACKWMINHYEQILWEADVFYDNEDMVIMTEHYNNHIDKYKQELLLLETQKQLEIIK